jgi:hypothetical protein
MATRLTDTNQASTTMESKGSSRMTMSRVTMFLALLAIVGIVDFLLNVAVLHFLRPDLPTQQRRSRHSTPSTQHVITTVEDFRATPETSAQVRSMGGIGDKPLAVTSAGQQSSS